MVVKKQKGNVNRRWGWSMSTETTEQQSTRITERPSSRPVPNGVDQLIKNGGRQVAGMVFSRVVGGGRNAGNTGYPEVVGTVGMVVNNSNRCVKLWWGIMSNAGGSRHRQAGWGIRQVSTVKCGGGNSR